MLSRDHFPAGHFTLKTSKKFAPTTNRKKFDYRKKLFFLIFVFDNLKYRNVKIQGTKYPNSSQGSAHSWTFMDRTGKNLDYESDKCWTKYP